MILQQLKNWMQNVELPAMAYHFAEYVNDQQANDHVVLAAALLSSQNLLGHVCIDLQDYANQTVSFADEPSDITAPSLSEWLKALHAHPWVSDIFPSPMILEGTRLYLGKYWKFETQLNQAIQARLRAGTTLNKPLLTSGLERLFPRLDNEIDWQGVAAAIALLNRFVVISGGPGTGKTSTVIRILALLLAQNPEMKIELVAPTGKAAARLAESIRKGKQDSRLSALTDQEKKLIPESAKTIHRLLRYSPRGFQHNKHHLIPVDTLVIDEASMIDLPLMSRLMDAIPASTHVILLGDRDQLSSVEAGSVLGDITGHGQNIEYTTDFIQQLESVGAIQKNDIIGTTQPTPTISGSISLLHKSYRFDDYSGIGIAAKLINNGRGKATLQEVLLNESYPDANWISSGNDSLNTTCITWAVTQYSRYIEQDNISDALAHFEQARVLTAMREGVFGMASINELITTALQRKYKQLIDRTDEFHGKPIMITRNDYELDLFNGDIGLLWMDGKTQQLRAYFPTTEGEIRSLSTRQLPQHETAFAMTIHKSQGSEFDNLLLILPEEKSQVVTKELIYTGLTRAKKNVLVAGSETSFINACHKTVNRSSGLGERLGW